jgi:hypothetical protein
VPPTEWLHALLWVAPLHETPIPAYIAHSRLAFLPLVEDREVCTSLRWACLQLDIDGHSSSQFVEIDFVVLNLLLPEVWHFSLDDFTELGDGVVFHVLHNLLVNPVAILADKVVVPLDQFAKFLVELGVY